MKTSTKTRPKTAVITRTKDRGILLERAIQSVHQQTDRDFVHVIVNDGGDQMVVDDLVKKYHKQIDGRVKVIHNPTSIGMEAASNKAIRSVNSTYIAIHDDDDAWHPEFLQQTTALLDAGQHGVIVSTDRIEEEIHNDTVVELFRERWLPHLRTLRLYDLTNDNFAVPISFIFQRAVYDEIGGFDSELPVLGDWDFALRFMRRYDIYLHRTPYALAYYYQRPKATGVLGNSVFAGADKHEYYNAVLANKYLRQDLDSGGLGLGYLFSTRDERKQRAVVEKQEVNLKEVTDAITTLRDELYKRTVNFERPKHITKRAVNKLRNIIRKKES